MGIMKIVFAVSVLIMLCLSAQAQSVSDSGNTPSYQSVSGKFAQNWIKNYLAKNPSPVPQVNDTSLWGWGNVPKGKTLVDGKLEDNYTYSENMTSNWLGDYFLNPYTGEPLDPAKYPGYYIPVYSSPNYINPYLPDQRQAIQVYA